ncbi:unnamed protein product, partial [Rotaria magnacalcarata]
VTKPTKQTTSTAPLGSKVPQLTLERIDTKNLKASATATATATTTTTATTTAATSTNIGSNEKLANKSLKLKRTNI